ncbi:MAG: putative RDD family membrane protein YckC [Gammaproteobacteria bacterium]
MRLAAFNIDMVIVLLAVTMLGFVATIALGVGAVAGLDVNNADYVEQLMLVSARILGTLLVLMVPLYFGLQTASSHQATVGKRVFDVYVRSKSDTTLSVLGGVWRAACYAPSALPLTLGFILGSFTKDKRTLHDYLAGTKVMHVTQGSSVTRGSARRAAMRSSDGSDAIHGANLGAAVALALGLLLLAVAATVALL